MAKYLLVYHGGSMPESPEDTARVMKAWTDWFGVLGPAVADGGNPAGATKRITPGGAVSDDPSGPSGYSILEAGSLDEAVRLAKGCPVLVGGGSIQVAEIIDVM
jgi:hypothetical protein